METKTINLYTFSELSKEVQEKLVKEECKNSLYLINNIVAEYFDEKIKERFGPDLKCYYSLNNCQGDGVAFDGSICIDTLLSNYSDKFDRKELRFFKFTKSVLFPSPYGVLMILIFCRRIREI